MVGKSLAVSPARSYSQLEKNGGKFNAQNEKVHRTRPCAGDDVLADGYGFSGDDNICYQVLHLR